MEKINSKKTTLSFFIIWFVYLAYYSFTTTIIRNNGYLNFEPLFITSHINTLFNSGELVKKTFLSYPLLTNLLSYPFSIFSAEDAPFFASIFYTSLFTTVVVTIVGKEKNIYFKTLLFLYFLLSPITFYAATSGTTLYAFYILYFLIFYYLFQYIKRFTTYHITILSIILSLVIFLDYRILWILPLLFFCAFIFSIYGIKGLLSSNIIIKYIKITQHKSLRRKFRGHLGSMIFIIGFFPIANLLLYLFINYLMGNDFYYFYNSLETKWNGNSALSLLNNNTIQGLNNKAVNDYSFIYIVALITPIYFFELLKSYRKELKPLILLLVPIMLYLLVRDSLIDYMNLSYYVIIIASGIASFTTTRTYLKKKRVALFSYALLFVISICGEYLYLRESSFTSEQVFVDAVVNKKQNNLLFQYKNGGKFLAENSPKNAVVLCDISIMYPLIAFNKKNNFFISNDSPDFKKAIFNPKKYCDYIIVSNTKSPFYFLDKVEVNLRESEEKRTSINNYRSKIVYMSDAFKIIKILK